MQTFWLSDTGYTLVPLSASRTNHEITTLFEHLRRLGHINILFLHNCTPVSLLRELISPTCFLHKSDYYILRCQEWLNCQIITTNYRGQTLTATSLSISSTMGSLCVNCFYHGYTSCCCENQSSNNSRKKRKQQKCECGKARPSYGMPNSKNPRWCQQCPEKHADAIDVKHKLCECGKMRPSFGIDGMIAQWCKSCPQKDLRAVNVVNKRCECGKAQASFGIVGSKKRQWCKDCPRKDPRAINIRQRCECGQARAYFGIIGTEAKWCKNCPTKNPKAVNVVSKRCECNRALPNFALPGSQCPRWCKMCPGKDSRAVNIKSKLCACKRVRPSFGLPNSKNAIWCKFCPGKPWNAINVVKRLCECGKAQPSFGLLKSKKLRWCKDCPRKAENAILLRSHCECYKTPRFATPGTKTRKWCKDCCPKDRPVIDLSRPRCPCGFRAYYGVCGQQASRCFTCKKDGMIRLPRQKCLLKECKSLAIYGKLHRTHCELHKENNERNLIERECISCKLYNVLDDHGLCEYCDPAKFKHFTERKEIRVKHVLDANHYANYKHNKIPNGVECGQERPDYEFELDTHVIILEVDEGQHNAYSCLCEQIRMINLSQTYGGKPVFWIRYNPDPFKSKDGAKNVTLSDHKRETHLIEWLAWAHKNPPKEPIEVIYLFYDGCSERSAPEEIQTMLTWHKE